MHIHQGKHWQLTSCRPWPKPDTYNGCLNNQCCTGQLLLGPAASVPWGTWHGAVGARAARGARTLAWAQTGEWGWPSSAWACPTLGFGVLVQDEL